MTNNNVPLLSFESLFRDDLDLLFADESFKFVFEAKYAYIIANERMLFIALVNIIKILYVEKFKIIFSSPKLKPPNTINFSISS